MAYGLKVFDVNGNIRLDVSNRLDRYIGTYTGAATTVTAGATVTIDLSTYPELTGLANDGTWILKYSEIYGFARTSPTAIYQHNLAAPVINWTARTVTVTCLITLITTNNTFTPSVGIYRI